LSSVLLAEGLELPIEEDGLEELPPRFEPGSSKAKLTWFGAICLEGIGMFVEAYIIITTGQVKTIWHAAYPHCFYPTHEMNCPNQIHCCGSFSNTPDTCGLNGPDYATDGLHQDCNPDGTYKSNLMCSEGVTGGISYAEFAGIMLGMITFGKVADLLGKHSAGMLTAVFQVIGVAMMTFYSSENLNVMFIVFAIFFFIFGFGVGGEYPLTAANAASHHVESLEEASLDDADRHHRRVLRERERTVRRGETIAMVFAMQGIGAVVGSIFLVCLIYFGEQERTDCDTDGYNPHGQSTEALSAIWRTFYFIGLIFVLMVLIYRGLVLEEGKGHKKLLARKERRRAKLGHENSAFQILWFYGEEQLFFMFHSGQSIS
jgi:MFS family permease